MGNQSEVRGRLSTRGLWADMARSVPPHPPVQMWDWQVQGDTLVSHAHPELMSL